MIKPTKWVCAQRRLRSAWPSAQSDQSLRCALSGQLRTQGFFMQIAKTLIRLGGCPGWQTGRMPRLIWVFAGRILILLVLSCRGSNIEMNSWHLWLVRSCWRRIGGWREPWVAAPYFLNHVTIQQIYLLLPVRVYIWKHGNKQTVKPTKKSVFVIFSDKACT